jgi:hypothetical protein
MKMRLPLMQQLEEAARDVGVENCCKPGSKEETAEK